MDEYLGSISVGGGIHVSLCWLCWIKSYQNRLSGLLPKNWKRAKRRRLLAERRTPLQGAGLRDDIKKSFENVLLPLGRADKGLPPGENG